MFNQVAGGDGTASWLLGVVCDLELSNPPPIATIPLGTGNNLPFAFGWVCYIYINMMISYSMYMFLSYYDPISSSSG